MKVAKEVLEELKKEIDYMWRIQSQNEYGATAVAYIDSRDAQNLLDEVVGPDNWQSDFTVIDGNLFGCVGIKVTHDDGSIEWVWKRDVGTESNTEKEKGNASDSFKRACVQWGVGRFLYKQEIQRLEVKKHTNGKFYPCDNTGKILWNGDELTKYINQKLDSLKKNTLKNVIPWSKEVQDKASKVEKNGIKGSVCLTKYIPEYNKAKGTKYNDIMQLKTDKELLDLIKFVENLTPESMK